MKTINIKDCPVNRRGGQTSYLLLSKGQLGSEQLAVTWVEGAPESEQPRHHHEHSEQVYVIVAGRGLMRVGDEEEEVGSGTLVFIPPGRDHCIRNVGDEPLMYVSATSPPFELPQADSPLAYSET